MNLLAVTTGAVQVVNPNKILVVRASTGSKLDDAGVPCPTYATPSRFTASVSDNVLTVWSTSRGKVDVGQTLYSQFLQTGTRVVGVGSTPGTFLINPTGQSARPSVMTSELFLSGQIQPLSWKDLQQIDGLNLQGTRNKIYLYGEVDAIVRNRGKGGDIVLDPNGDVFLVAQNPEQWGLRWCAVYATLQNDKSKGIPMSYTLPAPFTINGPGDQLVIPNTPGKSIYIFGIVMKLSGDTNFQFKSGANPLSGVIPGRDYDQGPDEEVLYTCGIGEDFIINLADTVSGGGTVWYGVN